MSMRPFNAINVQKVCLHGLELLPFQPYTPPKKCWSATLKSPITFTAGGCPGVSLKPAAANAAQVIDGGDNAIFDGCGAKVTWVIQLPGWKPFRPQKHAYTFPKGKRVPNTRAKVVQQAAEVMAAFIAQKTPDAANAANGYPVQFGDGGIKLEDLVILELRHVAKSSFQPIFGVKCNCPLVPVVVPQSPDDMWLEDTYQWGDGPFCGDASDDLGVSYPDAHPYALTENLGAEDDLTFELMMQGFNTMWMNG